MKIIHTSDWHIGQNFYRYDRYDEHSKVLDQIIGICRTEKPDALLVSGDIFDVAQPPAQAQRLAERWVPDQPSPACTASPATAPW